MTTTPRGSPELAASQAVPETTVNEQIRRTEGGAGRYPIADRVTAPPGTCADGAQYIIIATATGAFASKEGQIAQAVGTNAASDWNYRVLGTIDEGIVAYVQDEDAEYKWNGTAWVAYGGSGYAPGGTDVALADGGTGASLTDPNADRVLFWDDSAGAVTWLAMGTGLAITGTTLDATGGSYSDEQAQDAIGAMVDGSLTYVDATPLLQRAALTGDVTASAGSNTTVVTNANVTATVTATGTPPTNAIGYLGSPQMSDQDDYTLVMADAGKHYYHVSGSTHTLTIPANGSVAFPIGTVIAIVNENGGGNLSIAITTDTLRWGSSTGTRTLAANGTATLLKVTSTVWRMTGDGIT